MPSMKGKGLLSMSEKYYEFASLSAFPELESQANLLIEEVFAYTKKYSFKTDFAPLTSHRNLSQRFVLIDSSRMEVVAHIGTRMRDFLWNTDTIPVCMIGGVAVKKELQGRGIFKSLMERTIATLESQCAFFLLWTDKHEMYEKWGFYLAGKQWCYRTNTPASLESHKTLYSKLNQEEQKTIQSLYKKEINARYFSPLRNEDDWQDIADITSSDLYVFENGYYFKNKGMDLQDVVHESVTTQSINQLLKVIGDKAQLWHPLNQPVDDHVQQDLQLVGLWRINKHSMALKKISLLLGAKVETHDWDFCVKHDGRNYSLKSHELLEEIFGYGNFNLRKDSVPLFISGLDSI